jgi:5-(carboxyamino)imidazole ribonucleotide mutase
VIGAGLGLIGTAGTSQLDGGFGDVRQCPGEFGDIHRFASRSGETAILKRYNAAMKPLIGVIMGSQSDWATMSHAAETLDELRIPYETRVVSAHRTPDLLYEYAGSAIQRGLKVIIAGAGGAAHLPGMTAAKTRLPVIGVPIKSRALNGLDSLLSIAQMPAGVPVATVAIGKAGAVNAALLAAAIVATTDTAVAAALDDYRRKQTERVLEQPDPAKSS